MPAATWAGVDVLISTGPFFTRTVTVAASAVTHETFSAEPAPATLAGAVNVIATGWRTTVRVRLCSMERPFTSNAFSVYVTAVAGTGRSRVLLSARAPAAE
jgi:hypothetical protein